VLNGHVHQILQKVEGNVTFHTARSTAFPQPVPGTAPSPGPMRNIPAGRLRSFLGVTNVAYVERNHALATTDTSLE
jgi:3',5'-cyclic-AMP phosphodiesterase